MGILIHWALVYYYLIGFYQGYTPSPLLRVLITLLVLLASWCYFMACLSDPGHIEYEIQDGFSDEKLNDRLYDQIVSGKQVKGYDIMHEHNDTELVE